MYSYLVDHLRPNAKVVIDGLTRSATTRPGSHKSAWSRLLKCQLETAGFQAYIANGDTSYETFDTLLLDNGRGFNGHNFLYSSLDDAVERRLARYAKFVGRDDTEVYSVNQPMPDIYAWCMSKKYFKFTPEELQLKQKVTHFDQVFSSSTAFIGDSHTPSVWLPGAELHAFDNKTLYNVLNTQTLMSLVGSHHVHVQFYFGNADIRHHLMRREDPVKAVQELVRDYAEQAVKVMTRGVQVVLTELLGIEDESRKLPKSAYHKGTPFYGSWAQRNYLKEVFNCQLAFYCKQYGLGCYQHPSMFLGADGKLKFSVMEKPSSIHISPEFYRTNLGCCQQRHLGF